MLDLQHKFSQAAGAYEILKVDNILLK